MTELKLVIADGATSYALTTKEAQAAGFLGKRLGETIGGELIGLPQYTLTITGGTDKNGFPMRADLTGPRQQRILTGDSPGFHPKKKGMRDRRTFRGNTISEETAQVCLIVTTRGPEPISALLGAAKATEAK
jgi:small subunit ribosomal protein S6e